MAPLRDITNQVLLTFRHRLQRLDVPAGLLKEAGDRGDDRVGEQAEREDDGKGEDDERQQDVEPVPGQGAVVGKEIHPHPGQKDQQGRGQQPLAQAARRGCGLDQVGRHLTHA